MQAVKKLFFVFFILSISIQIKGQELFSTAWYFEHYQPFDMTHGPVGFASPDEAWVFDGRPGVFFKITSNEELEKVKNYTQPERIRGIFIDKSLLELDEKDLESTLTSLPNLQFLQFSGTSFFEPLPNQLIPFPDFIDELNSLSIVSFLGPLEFTEESLFKVLSTQKRIEGLFFYGERGKIHENLLTLPNLKALRCGAGSLPEGDFANQIEYLEVQGTDKSGFTDAVLEQAKKLKKLSHLSIRYGRLSSDFDFGGLEKLTYLNLENLDSTQDFQVFHKISVLENLKKLKIWNLRDSKQDFSYLSRISSLKSLFLGRIESQNNRSPLESIDKLSNLEELSLSEMKLDFEEHTLSNLTKLNNLILTYNSIQSLPPKLFKDKPLERVILSYNQLTSLQGIEICRQLKELQVQGNQLQDISFLDSGFPNLRLINASENQIQKLPEDFSKLSSLSNLNLARNQITIFPLELSALPHIDTVHFNGNPVAGFRGEMQENNSLRELILVGTTFESLPEDFSKFRNLSYLMLSHGRLRSIPTGFRNLSHLDLSSQKSDSSYFFQLPPDLHLNTGLESLDIGFSESFQLSSLSDFLSKFTPTKPFSLDLGGMGLEELPEGDFWEKINWGSIELTSNQIEELPESWKNLKKFERIQLYGNPVFPGKSGRLFFTSYPQLAVLLYLQGQEINLAEIPRADLLAGIDHLIPKYRPEVHGEIIIQLAELAEMNAGDGMEIPGNVSEIGLAFFSKGEFSRAIPFLEIHLQKFLDQRIRVQNLIYETLEGLEISYAKENEVHKLIDLYLLEAKELGIHSGFFYAGLLSKKYGPTDASETYFNQGLAIHEKRLLSLESTLEKDPGFILEYLESCLITGDEKRFKRISEIAESWTEADENYKTIFQMLSDLHRLQKGDSVPENEPKNVSGWSFSLLELWIDLETKPESLRERLNNYRISNL